MTKYETDCGPTCLEMLGYTIPQEEELRNWRISSEEFPNDFVEVYERVTPKTHWLGRIVRVLIKPLEIGRFLTRMRRKIKRAYERFFFTHLHVEIPDFESMSDKPIMFNGDMITAGRMATHWCIYYRGMVYDPNGEQLTIDEFTERGVSAIYYCYELKNWPNIDKNFKLDIPNEEQFNR